MTGRPTTPAHVWLSPETPGALADAVLRAGGEIVPADRANAILWYAHSALGPAEVQLVRSLLRDSVAWVQLNSAGVEEWFELGLVDAARVWTSAAGAFAAAVAEHTVALLLAAAKRLPECARADSWRKPELEGLPLAGSTIGIVGAGAIGRETIRRLEPFGVRVIASTRSGTAVPGAERSLAPGDLDELLVESDYVVMCAPLTPETHGLIGARELDLVGPRGVLVTSGGARWSTRTRWSRHCAAAASLAPSWMSRSPSRCRPGTRSGASRERWSRRTSPTRARSSMRRSSDASSRTWRVSAPASRCWA